MKILLAVSVAALCLTALGCNGGSSQPPVAAPVQSMSSGAVTTGPKTGAGSGKGAMVGAAVPGVGDPFGTKTKG